MSGAIRGARILTPDESLETGTVVFDGAGRITAVGSGAEPAPGIEITDARGLTLVPGFIDLHVHGGGGFSLATHDAAGIESYGGWVVSHGVTSFVATVCATDLEEGLAYTRIAAQAVGRTIGGANLLGLNLEG